MNDYSWSIIAVIAVLLIISALIGKNQVSKKVTDISYSRKDFLSRSEKNFLSLITPLTKYDLIIIPQVNLASIIKKDGNARFNTELFRNIDFGIFDKNHEIRLLIELNDATHNQKRRQYRDIKVHQITKSAGIPILTFYTDKPNKQDYVLHRITETLKNGGEK